MRFIRRRGAVAQKDRSGNGTKNDRGDLAKSRRQREYDGECDNSDRRARSYAIFYTVGVSASAAAPFTYGLVSDAIGVPLALALIAAVVGLAIPLALVLRAPLAALSIAPRA